MASDGCMAMVLAAGFGSRLEPFSSKFPKPLLPFFDVPLIDYTLSRVVRTGIKSIVVNLHHRADVLRPHLEGAAVRLADEHGVELHLSVEEEILGTGGGLARARSIYDGRTLMVVNSDIYLDFDLTDLLSHHRGRGASATALLHNGEGLDHLRSTLTDDAGRIVSIGRAEPGNLAKGVFAGAYVLEPEVYRLLPERKCSVIEAGFLPALRSGLTVLARRRNFCWHDLGTWEGLAAAVFAVLGSSGPSALTEGPYREVLELSPGRFVFDGSEEGIVPPAYIGPSVENPTQAAVGPFAAVGARCRLGPGAGVSNSMVLPGCEVTGLIESSIVWEEWSTRLP